MASPEIRERRRTLRYRNLLVRQAVQTKNKTAVLLMEAGVAYNKQRLHKVGYFRELLATSEDIDDGLRSLLRMCHETVVRLGNTALFWAAFYDRRDVIHLLLSKGADINKKSKGGESPLHVALRFNHDSAADLLRGAGARE
jgi:hypothetical protein